MRKRLVAGFGALIIGAAIAVAAGVRWFSLVAHPLSGPTALTWYRADGGAMPDTFSGCFGDPGLELATWRGGAIVTCDNAAIDRGWAFLDPVARTAELRWQLRSEGGAITTLGLIPGPRDQLAIAFERAGDRMAWIGVAGPDGWLREPVPLAQPYYWAGAWVGDVLQVVTGPAPDEQDRAPATVTVVSITGAPQKDVSFGACPSCIRSGPVAIYRAGGRWIYDVGEHAYAEDGREVDTLRLGSQPIDLVAHGALLLPAFNHDRPLPAITRAGTIVAGATPPRPDLHADHLQRVAIHPDGTITRTPTWHLAGQHRATFVELGPRLVAWWIAGTDLRIADVPADGRPIPTLPPVARWPRTYDLRILIPDATGAWMLDSAGERIRLDAALHRSDALPLATCLRHHGCTERATVDDRGVLYAMRWLLFGLPLLVAAYLSLAVVARHRPRLWVFAVLAAGYLGSAAWLLCDLLPQLSALG